MTTRLILVGGFLGAGKTTLLRETALKLAERGLKAGLITNDQAPELVDTALLSRDGVNVAEVNGSCFCCNFPGLLGAISKVRTEATAEVIIAEPVGSCTDLSATIVQPLKDQFKQDLEIAPLSVLADPARLADILEGGTAGLHPSAAYIFRKQIEEADIVVISKTDLLTPDGLNRLKAQLAQVYPRASVFAVSAKSGAGLEAWLDEVLRRSDAGQYIAEVDYDVYAEGEAVLGWLNATIALHGAPTEWNLFARRLLENLSQRFDGMNASVGHVKILLEAGNGFLVGNLTGNGDTLNLRGEATTGPAARLTVNARVQMSPEELERIVREAIASACNERLTASPLAWRCLSPGRPNPTHRYARAIAANN